MAIEIERKFLFDPEILSGLEGLHIQQGYLQTDKNKTVRVRTKGDKAFLTVKGKNDGIARQEFEYEIPFLDGVELLKMCDNKISKTRFILKLGQHTWELDEFHEMNEGLFIAEIELSDVNETFNRPEWVLEEVSHDKKYFNSYLSQNPFRKW